MTREHLFWQHYVVQHPTHGVLTFSTSAAVATLLCLSLLVLDDGPGRRPLRRVRRHPGPLPLPPARLAP